MKAAPKENRTQKPKQGQLPFKSWGGARKGAGRKPKNGVAAGVKHEPRPRLASSHPAHVTLKLRSGLPRLRQKAEYAALRAAFAKGRDRFGFRLCHYAVLNDHLHLICEAVDQGALRRGRVTVRGLETIERPLTDARSWLLQTGWRRHGLLPTAATA